MTNLNILVAYLRKHIIITTLLTITFLTLNYLPGGHQQYVRHIEKVGYWGLYWVGLGIASSIGFGTGLHTFVLYLGPHIAAVTMAAN